MKAIITVLFLVCTCFASGTDEVDNLIDSVYTADTSTHRWAESASNQFPDLFSSYHNELIERVLKTRYAGVYDVNDTSVDALMEISGGKYITDLVELQYNVGECRTELIFWVKYVDLHKNEPASIPFYAHIRCIERGYDAIVKERGLTK